MEQINNYTGQDLTLVICAYKECLYLEECVKAIMSQTVKTKVLISTSTPNDYIKNIADKYSIEIRVNPNGGQVKDYNFAMKQADTELVMLAHQDDLLALDFVEKMLLELNRNARPIIAFSNYCEIHEDATQLDSTASTLVKVKRIMLLPLSIKWIRQKRWGKRLIQCIGNPITHPSVVCVKKEMPEMIFREEYKACMDWDLWERLSKQKGSFVYVKDILLFHRMDENNQTVKLFKTSNARYDEELEIMCRFWPKFVAKAIMGIYKNSAKYY